MHDAAFTPALGRPDLTGFYDRAIRWLTRERVWRPALVAQVDPCDGETILDVGCGTGTLAIMLKMRAPAARVIGLDPDPAILALAAAKAKRQGAEVEWRQGYASDAAAPAGAADKAVSSLVFHQVPIAGKFEGLAAMFSAVRPGGEVHIADYAKQPDWLMRRLFRLTVQQVDGLNDTQPNADGLLESLLGRLGGPEAARPTTIFPTPTGAISLFRAVKPSRL